MVNFEAVSHYEKSGNLDDRSVQRNHLIPAIKGFFRSITLNPALSLQGSYRIYQSFKNF